MKQSTNLALYASFVSTVLISLNMMSVYFLFDYLNLLPTLPNEFYAVFSMITIWIINYYGIVKKEEFMKYNFKKDKKGGFFVVVVILLTFLIGILIANLNREKIFKEKEIIESYELKKESLEGKIRKLFD